MTIPLITADTADVIRLRRLATRARKRRSVRNELSGVVSGSVIQAGTIGSVVINRPPAPVGRGELAEIADQLAQAVDARWRGEEAQRRIQDPVPLPVRWRTAPENLTDQWDNILRVPAGQRADPLDLSGQLDEIRAVYGRITSGRLVVLGRAGSGKTVLAVRLVLDMLADRVPGTGSPVPVIFSIGSWNPADGLADLLINRLIRDHPGLAAAAGPDRATLAAALVGARLVLPVLDGFDEIADGLHRAALQELSATTLPMLLTSRLDEYAAAVARTRGLTLAAGIELVDLTVDSLEDYLPRTTARLVAPGAHSGTTTKWSPVLDELRHVPPSPAAVSLSSVLTTPLMVALARTVYSDAPDRDPQSLLDEGFNAPATLEDHLLDSFIPSLYQLRSGSRRTGSLRTWDPERARRWLGYLAGHLDELGTRDLAWWELGTTARRSTRAVVIGLMAGLVFGGVTAVGNLPVDLVGTSRGLDFAILRGLVVGALHGLMVGLVFGGVYWFAEGNERLKPSPVRIRLFRGPRQLQSRLAARLVWGVMGGAVVAISLLLVDRLIVPVLDLSDGFDKGSLGATLAFPPEMGLGAGLVFGLSALFESRIDVRSAVSPAGMLRSNRANVIFHLLMWVFVFGPEIGLIVGVTVGPVRAVETGAVFGLEGAFGAGFGYVVSLTAWGQWVALARIWLPLTGRLPWRLVAFLDDACQRGVLRQAGAVYQFRHARLQDSLIAAPEAR